MVEKIQIQDLRLETPYYFGFKCCQFIQEHISKDWIRTEDDPVIKPKKYIKKDFISWSTEMHLFRCVCLLTNASLKSPYNQDEWDEKKKINLIAVFNVFGSFLDILRYQLKENAYKQLLFLLALILNFCNENGIKYLEEQKLIKQFQNEYEDITQQIYHHKNFLNTQGSLFLIVPPLIERFFKELPEILEKEANQNLKTLIIFEKDFEKAKQIINIFLQFAYSQEYLNDLVKLEIEEKQKI